MLHDLAILIIGIALGMGGTAITSLAVVVLTQPRGDAGEHLGPGG